MDGLKKAHIRDGAAIVQYIVWLDKQVCYEIYVLWTFYVSKNFNEHCPDCLNYFLFYNLNKILSLKHDSKLLSIVQMQEIYGASGYFLEGEATKEKKHS